MGERSGEVAADETGGAVRVRYWASARSAAGVVSDALPVTGATTLGDVVRRAAALHPGSDLARVLSVCSVLVGDRPVKSADADAVLVHPGDTVEFLPPFAGG